MGMQGLGAAAASVGAVGQDWFAFTARRLVAAEFRVAESELAAANRCERRVAFARQVAMYMAHVAYQLSYDDVAKVFGRERTTVAYACAQVEDARDDPDLEERLDKVERRMRDLARIVRGQPTAAARPSAGVALRVC